MSELRLQGLALILSAVRLLIELLSPQNVGMIGPQATGWIALDMVPGQLNHAPYRNGESF